MKLKKPKKPSHLGKKTQKPKKTKKKQKNPLGWVKKKKKTGFFQPWVEGGHLHLYRGGRISKKMKKIWTRIRICRIRMILALLDPSPLVRGMDPDPDLSIIKQK